MVKIGLIGLGYLGKIHLKLLKDIQEFQISGIYDIDQQLTASLANECNVKAFSSLQQLMEASDAIDIVTPSVTHFEIAQSCIAANKHVFIEKPATSSVKESILLRDLLRDKNLVVQIGHVERFNPAFLAVKSNIQNPDYIECSRLAQYNPRGTDVSVTHDLMIHDLDLVLSFIKSKIINIEAKGIKQISQSNDIVNARVQFENGCIAQFTTNRISSINERKITVYQRNTIIEADLLHKTAEIRHYENLPNSIDLKTGIDKGVSALKKVINETQKITPSNAIKEELISFHHSINSAKKPVVTLDDAINVLDLAFRIEEKTLQPVN